MEVFFLYFLKDPTFLNVSSNEILGQTLELKVFTVQLDEATPRAKTILAPFDCMLSGIVARDEAAQSHVSVRSGQHVDRTYRNSLTQSTWQH